MKRSSRTVLMAKFEEMFFEIPGRIRRVFGYTPAYLLRMGARLSGLGASKRFLQLPAVSSGFVRLVRGGHPELTIEALVLDPQFAPIFTPEELAIARQRLAGVQGLAVAA